MRRNLPRRWACLILGGALLMPYMMVGVLVAGLLSGESANLFLPAQVGVFAAVLPVVALTGLFLPVRGLEVSAAQGLLGARVEVPPRQSGRSWQERRRTAAWFTVHLAVGGVVSGFTLAIVPFTLFTLGLPFAGRAMPVLGALVTPGWNAMWWAMLGLATLAALVAIAVAAGALLARLAPVLLGPTPAERLAAAEEHARTLAERNRLARELHDSVGHALSVVTLQAAAAGRVLDRDPATARTALAAIEQSARAALEDLDHVLGVLREDDRDRDHDGWADTGSEHAGVRGGDREGGNAGIRTGDDRGGIAPGRTRLRGDGRWEGRQGDPSGPEGRRSDPSEWEGRQGDPSGPEGHRSDPSEWEGRQGDPSGPEGRRSDPGGPARADEAGRDRRRAPQATLANLGELVAASGAKVRQEVGDLSGVPAVVSREAYRILQEALTNAIKHGHGPVRLSAAVDGDDLRLEVTNAILHPGGSDPGDGHDRAGGGDHAGGRRGGRKGAESGDPGNDSPAGSAGDTPTATSGDSPASNPADASGGNPVGAPGDSPAGASGGSPVGVSGGGGWGGSRGGGGRGVAGMRERVRLLRGEVQAGPAEGGWQVRVRLPLRSSA
ncbi:histidine kinase [Nonomuraea insulae]|uniref:histidine kinase n=1 Tax=Nonomuraea insulae TaxID=1616787 RepID=A0ABW1CCS2_9ACTN